MGTANVQGKQADKNPESFAHLLLANFTLVCLELWRTSQAHTESMQTNGIFTWSLPLRGCVVLSGPLNTLPLSLPTCEMETIGLALIFHGSSWDLQKKSIL